MTVEKVSLDQPVTLLHGDVVDALEMLPDQSVHAVITDPPYALAMGGGTEGWDNYTPPRFAAWCQQWSEELVRVLKPGGWVVAFGSGRTWHRLTQGMEDAGLDIIDSVIWHYPSGFMRNVNIPERLAKAGSPERARQMAGRGTALHSRHEPAILARAPLKGSLVSTVAEHGTATMDLTSTRLPNGTAPPNVLVQHSPFCGGDDDGLECVVGCPVPEMGQFLEYFPAFRFEGKPGKDERPKIRVEAGQGTKKLSTLGQVQLFSCRVCSAVTQSYMGAGGVYAKTPHRVCDHDAYEPIRENFSATIAHNTVKPLGLMRWLIRLLTLPGDTVLEPFAGSGSTVEAAVIEGRQVIGIERDLTSIDLCRVRLRRQGCFIAGES